MKKILLLISGMLVAFIAIEIGLRILVRQTTLKFYDNDVIGSALVPNQSGWFISPTNEYFTQVSVNSQGWPDIEHTENKPKDTYRILILGDSFVENFQVPLEKRFFRQLENRLNNEALLKSINKTKIEVVAIGRGNTGTAQEYLMLKNFGLKYQPDLIVQTFFTGNDVANNDPVLQNDPYLPYFSIDSKGNLSLISPIKRSQRSLASIKEELKKLRIIDLILSLRQKLIEKRDNYKSGYPTDYHVYDNIYSQEYQNAWNLTYKLIEETKKLAGDANSNYMLTSVPASEQFQLNKQKEIFSTYPLMDKNKIDFEKPDKLLEDFCTIKKITCNFMLPVFKQFYQTNPGSPTYFFYDGHWTETGTNLTTEFLFEKITDYLTIK